jgi:hypothetical protein
MKFARKNLQYRGLIFIMPIVLTSITGFLSTVLAAVTAFSLIEAEGSSSNDSLKDWSCPMYGLDNFGEDIEEVENVASWEDCGTLRPNCY